MPEPISLILASASPRRRELLQNMGVKFSTASVDIDESIKAHEVALDFVERLAQQKARACAAALPVDPYQAVLSADTIVKHDEMVFGKPTDVADAMRLWRQLSDTQHQVVTAVSLLFQGDISTVSVSTDVYFSKISEQQMQAYWLTGEPQDKAGGYAIQGLASAWVKLIHGSYSNVVGLPLYETNQLLRRINLNWL